MTATAIQTQTEQAQPPASADNSIVSLIERAAKDPTIDLDRMERLYEMRERMLAREAETAFHMAMQAAQAEMPRVHRDAKNSQSNSQYARLETIAKAISPVYTKHGFSLSFGTDASPFDGHYRVTCDIAHVGGHVRQRHADLPSDSAGFKGNANKTAIQGFGSTMSYGRRYLTLLIFNVALTNEDDDGQAAGRGETISPEQLAELRAIADQTGADVRRFCQYLRVESLADLPAGRFSAAVSALRAKERR